MINTIVLTKDLHLLENIPIENIDRLDPLWYWVDFKLPTDEESGLLKQHFKFHDLAIEDCIDDLLERPKVDYYDTYKFFVLYALNQNILEPIELELFVGNNYVVTFCKEKLPELSMVRQTILNKIKVHDESHYFIVYKLFDSIVDSYYPVVYQTEDYLEKIEINESSMKIPDLIEEVFKIRSTLMRLRKIISPMKDLLYDVINSERLEDIRSSKLHFNDIYDHLVRLWETLETSRDITSDIRDNYVSINAHRMNTIVTVLTIITTIFTPLTFIVGLYGMNFEYMPELKWKYGYFLVLSLMGVILLTMILLFKKKGWFDIKK